MNRVENSFIQEIDPSSLLGCVICSCLKIGTILADDPCVPLQLYMHQELFELIKGCFFCGMMLLEEIAIFFLFSVHYFWNSIYCIAFLYGTLFPIDLLYSPGLMEMRKL